MTRLIDAWRALGREQHTTALVALGLFVTMLLPWYSKTNTLVVHGRASATEQSLSAFQAFSFVEAAVLLVSAGVLAMLFARGEGREFQLPGGDGLIVSIAGGWAAILIFYRLLDKPGLQGNARISSTVGVQWGIFIALLVALGLLYAGRRMHASERSATPLTRPAAAGPRERRESSRRRGEDEETRARSGEEPHTRANYPRSPAGAGDEELTAATRPVPASGAPDSPPGPAAPAGPFAQERRARRPRPRYPPAPGGRDAAASEQLSFEEEPPRSPREE